MKVPISWLREYIEMDVGIDVIAEKLTDIGLEVEEIVNNKDKYSCFKIAEIIETYPHPNADKLKICSVYDGNKTLQIICGAPNARAGIKVVLAQVGTIIPANGMKIKKAKIRDIESNGMLCSAHELQLGEDEDGILELKEYDNNDILSALGLEEYIINISVTPNRGDCFSIYGIARDLAAAGIGKLIPIKTSEMKGRFESPIEAQNLIPEKSELFVGRYFRNIHNAESPKWMQNRLKNVSIASISALVDISNYITIALGRPSHIYDANKLRNNLYITNGEAKKFTALNGEEYQIIQDDIIIKDDDSIHSIAGIIGGENSRCEDDTINIFLEIAMFDSTNITLTGRRIGLQTEARYRFERGIDKNLTFTVLHVISELIIKICGGEASEPVIAGNIDVKKRTIEFNPFIIKQLIGIEIEGSELILRNLGFEIDKKEENFWEISVPSWRNDINIPTDLVEEIIRIYGYSNLPKAKISYDNFSDVRQNISLSLLPRINQIRKIMTTRGLNEAITWSFMNSKMAKVFDLESSNLLLSNPISVELDMMRPSIIPNLLEAALRNFNRKYQVIKLFEIGPIYNPKDRANTTCIAAIRAGNAFTRNIHLATRDVNIFDIKLDVIFVFKCLNLPNNLAIEIKNPPSYYCPGKFGAFYMGKSLLAYFGILHPDLSPDLPIAACEIFLDNIPQMHKKRTFSSKYPSVSRDFSFILDFEITAIEITQIINKSNKQNLIRNVEIFDIYRGTKIPIGKKSVAFNIILQADNRSLTSEEINKISDNVVNAISTHLGGVLRLDY